MWWIPRLHGLLVSLEPLHLALVQVRAVGGPDPQFRYTDTLGAEHEAGLAGGCSLSLPSCATGPNSSASPSPGLGLYPTHQYLSRAAETKMGQRNP